MSERKVVNGKVVIRSNKYPNYGASEEGEIYRWSTCKKMSYSFKSEYLYFRACHNNTPKNVRVHIVVAECWVFNSDPELKIQVNHIDGNKLNNQAKNLEWVTRSQNQRHAISTGLKGKGEALYNSTMTEDIAHQVCQHLVDGWRSVDIAKKFELSNDVIYKIKDGSTYFHIRSQYSIPHQFKKQYSESTIRWVCEQILKGFGDTQISTLSKNSNLSKIEVKRIREKIRYKKISDEYF